MNTRERRLHEVFAVLAPPRRFELLALLVAGGNRSVSQLADEVGLSQSCTTRHLQALESMGLVRGTREGKRVVFRVHALDEAAGSVLASLGVGASGPGGYEARLWTEVLPTPAGSAVRVAASPRSRERPRGHGQSTGTPPPSRPTHPERIPAEPAAVSPPPRESAIESATPPAPPRRRDEIEDFLL